MTIHSSFFCFFQAAFSYFITRLFLLVLWVHPENNTFWWWLLAVLTSRLAFSCQTILLLISFVFFFHEMNLLSFCVYSTSPCFWQLIGAFPSLGWLIWRYPSSSNILCNFLLICWVMDSIQRDIVLMIIEDMDFLAQGWRAWTTTSYAIR